MITRAPAIWCHSTGTLASGRMFPTGPARPGGKASALRQRVVDLLDLAGNRHCLRPVERLGFDIHHVTDVLHPALAERLLREAQDALRPITRSTSSRSSLPTSTTRGRTCSTANSPSAPSEGRFTANSTSTGQLIARSPRASRSVKVRDSGKTPVLRIGANVTRRIPGRDTPSYTASLSAEYTEPTW